MPQHVLPAGGGVLGRKTMWPKDSTHDPSPAALLRDRHDLLECNRILQFRAVRSDAGRAAGHRNDRDIEQLNHFVAEPHPFDDIAMAEIDHHEAAPRRSLAPG